MGDDWTECLAESQMPEDELTFTDGLTGLLQGYDFTETIGEGVEEHARLPEAKGLSQLPGEFVKGGEESLDFGDLTESEDGFDLGEMLSEEEGGLPVSAEEKQAASMADLQWLDPTQEQNPERLPRPLVPNDVDSPEEPSDPNSVWISPEVAEAWGVDRRTDGLHWIPNRDKEVADYDESIKEGPKSGLPQPLTRTAKTKQIRDSILRAVRRSHYGHSLQDIKEELVQTLGEDARKTRKAMKIIEAEHGLAGNVFVRASAFPGLRNGKWVDQIKKHSRLARYVITDDETIASKLGMEAVPDVQNILWGITLAHYAPRLQSGGYPLKGDNAKDILRKAFLSGPQERKPEVALKPTIKTRVATKQEARAEIEQAAQEKKPTVKSSEQQAREKKHRAALVQIARYVKEGKLSQDDALRIHDSGASPYQMLKAASNLMLSSGNTPVYEGEGIHLSKQAQAARQEVWDSLEAKQAEVESEMTAKLKKNLTQAVKAGLLTKKEAKRIFAMDKKASERFRIAKVAIQVAHEKRTQEIEVSKTKEYEGATLTAAPQQRHAGEQLPFEIREIQKISKKSGIRVGEFLHMIRWARQKMTEGSAGSELDQLLQARFSPDLLKAGKSLLRKARDEHEGLSGFLYVDSAAYASKAGSEGCQKHASRHRANGLKYVLAMDRCADCVYANSEGVCQQFNKTIVTEPPVKNKKAYQKKAIEMADAPDHEVTASLFDPQEYNLRSEPLENVPLDDEYAPTEHLSDVFFGGMEID